MFSENAIVELRDKNDQVLVRVGAGIWKVVLESTSYAYRERTLLLNLSLHIDKVWGLVLIVKVFQVIRQ